MPLKFSYDFLLLLAAIYVCWKGGWAGRASVGALSVAYALSEYLYTRFLDEGEFVERLLIVDASLLMIQILIACSSRKSWLIWVAAFQLNTVLSEYAAWMAPSYKWSIFYLLATVWAAPTREFDQRGQHLPAHYFADPAFMILLDLYAHDCRRRRVSVSSLCIASRAPATTALRWIRALVEDGLVERECDPNDARRVFVKLSVVGRNRLTAYLGELSSFGTRKDGLCSKDAVVRLAADHGKAIK